MGLDGRLHMGRCWRCYNSGCMLNRREGSVRSQIFGDFFIWPFAVLLELGRIFWTVYAVRLGQFAKNLLLVAFVKEK